MQAYFTYAGELEGTSLGPGILYSTIERHHCMHRLLEYSSNWSGVFTRIFQL